MKIKKFTAPSGALLIEVSDEEIQVPDVVTIDPGKMGGVPCVRGLRIPVARVLDYVASGVSVAEIVELHPDLTPLDVEGCIRFAASLVRELRARAGGGRTS